MVIDDGHFFGTSFGPDEDDAPLVVDTNGVIVGEVAFESFESIAEGDSHVVEFRGLIELNELPERNSGDVSEWAALLVVEKFFGVRTVEGLNHAEASLVAGVTALTRARFSFARARKSHSHWIPCQKVSLCSKNAPKRIDMVGVMLRLLRTISFTARGGTPMARAIAFWEISRGLRYSLRRISPGVMLVMGMTYRVMGWIQARFFCELL